MHCFLPALDRGAVIFGNSSASNSVDGVLMKELIDSVFGVHPCDRVGWAEQKKRTKLSAEQL